MGERGVPPEVILRPGGHEAARPQVFDEGDVAEQARDGPDRALLWAVAVAQNAGGAAAMLQERVFFCWKMESPGVTSHRCWPV